MFHRTQELLIHAERVQTGCVGRGSNSQPLGFKTKCLAFELHSSKDTARKESSLFRWCIASLLFLSYLICDRLLIGELHMFYRTQEPLVPAENSMRIRR